MKAMVVHRHGGAEVMELVSDFPDPDIGKGDVLIGVRASSLNYHDVFTRRGMPGIRITMPLIMGLDIAGEIVAVGPGVEGWSAGDRVLIDPINRVEGGLMGETVHGGLAELCRARAHQLVRIPDAVSYVDAAALPVAYGTAHRMLVSKGNVHAGDRVMILGASGGVGVCCMQLAKQAGAQVVACASSEAKLDRLRALGADHLVNYAERDFVQEVYALYGKPSRRGANVGNGLDVVVNFTGGDTWVKSMRCLKVGGRLLTCGATAGYDPQEDIRFIWTFELEIRGSNGWQRSDIVALLDMVRERRLNTLVERTYPLEEAAEALRVIEDREVFGKIVVTP
jgi:alcohol dehydrogenase